MATLKGEKGSANVKALAGMTALSMPLGQIKSEMRERPDLLAADSGGPSFGPPDYKPKGKHKVETFMGWVITQDDLNKSAKEILKRFPSSELKGAGQGVNLMKAIIPAAIWKKFSPEAKQVVRNYAIKNPENIKKVLKDPQILLVQIKKLEKELGNFKVIGKNKTGSMTARASKIKIRPDSINSTTPQHEFQHFLNRDRVGNTTDPMDAATVAEMLYEVIPGRKTSMDNLNEYLTRANLAATGGQTSIFPGLKGEMEKIMWHGKGKITNVAAQREAESSLVKNAYTGKPQDFRDAVRFNLMDEALAYLAQSASKKDPDPLIQKMAKALGVDPK